MKRKKFYTLILAENNSSPIKTMILEKKYFQLISVSLIIVLLLLMAFLTDYVSLHIDQWEMSQLKKENQQLKQKFVSVESQLQDLEQKVHQISSFSAKLQMITKAKPDVLNQQMGFGKVHTNPIITALSIPSPAKRELSSLRKPIKTTPSQDISDFSEKAFGFVNHLEIRIDKLKEKSTLVKEDTWTLFTDLLEKKEILSNTPSILPAKGWLSSGFGYRNESIYSDHEPHFHRGVDIASTEGNPVVASADGKVVYTGYDDYGYGNLVVIDHGYGLKTYYAHLAAITTSVNKNIQRGEIIGEVGSTGRSTGSHLHYEVRIYGKPVNPENYILDQEDFSLAHFVQQQKL